ncbi:MAG: hypothetical protein VX874_07325 [Pseudomonadota bacterium]|nr:hypothetical protein [Pseudomonadota bacterium]
MVRVILFKVQMLVVVVLLAASSLVSTSQMAPNLDETARFATLSFMGATLADLCGDEEITHDHDCPFCHKLPSPPTCDHVPTVWPAPLRSDVAKGDHLIQGHQYIAGDPQPRAPPHTA